MKIGCLGDIVFQVSDSVIETISNLQFSGSATYQTHSRHLTNALTEFVGLEPDTITFDLVLSTFLGVAPEQELNKIVDYERKGKVLQFVIGTTSYGKYRWTITNHKVKVDTFGKGGAFESITVSLTIQEYLKS